MNAGDANLEGELVLAWRAHDRVVPLEAFLLDAKRQYFRALLAHAGNNITQVSRLAGCNRTATYVVLHRLGIDVPRAFAEGQWDRPIPGDRRADGW